MKELSKLLSIDISFLIVGALGGLIAMNNKENKKKSKWERFLIGISGVCSAGLLTPLIIWVIELFVKTPVPISVQLGFAYAVGLAGSEVMNWLIDLIALLKEFKKFKNLKDDK